MPYIILIRGRSYQGKTKAGNCILLEMALEKLKNFKFFLFIDYFWKNKRIE